MGEGHQDDLFPQCVFEGFQGAVDQVAAVVKWRNRHPGGQARGERIEAGFDVLDHLVGVLAVTHDDDAADHFAAVHVERSAAEITANAHRGDVA